jgi:hypothetical protein
VKKKKLYVLLSIVVSICLFGTAAICNQCTADTTEEGAGTIAENEVMEEELTGGEEDETPELEEEETEEEEPSGKEDTEEETEEETPEEEEQTETPTIELVIYGRSSIFTIRQCVLLQGKS